MRLSVDVVLGNELGVRLLGACAVTRANTVIYNYY